LIADRIKTVKFYLTGKM